MWRSDISHQLARLRQHWQGVQHQSPFAEVRRAWLGQRSADGSVHPNPKNGLERSYVWVRFSPDEQAIRAVNLAVRDTLPDVEVLVARHKASGQWMVVGLAPGAVNTLGDAAQSFAMPDRLGDVVNETISPHRLKNLLPRITGQWTLTIDAGLYRAPDGVLTAFEGAELDLSTYVPSGALQKQVVYIGIDLTTNIAQVEAGSLVSIALPPRSGKYFDSTTLAQDVANLSLDVVWLYAVPLVGNAGALIPNSITDLAKAVPHLPAPPMVCQGRLTPTSTLPIAQGESSGNTTVYFTPYLGNEISLYDGLRWRNFRFAEIALDLTGFAADTNFDVFAYAESGQVALETLAWTDNLTRAAGLGINQGVLVRASDHSRRYLGTFHTNLTGGQVDFNLTARGIWNYANRASFRLYISDATTHTYAVNSFREWNGTSGVNQVQMLIGYADQVFEVNLLGEVDPGNGFAYMRVARNNGVSITGLPIQLIRASNTARVQTTLTNISSPTVGNLKLIAEERGHINTPAPTFYAYHLNVLYWG
jgi:hypothetical protein